jgi:hypothetical protein
MSDPTPSTFWQDNRLLVALCAFALVFIVSMAWHQPRGLSNETLHQQAQASRGQSCVPVPPLDSATQQTSSQYCQPEHGAEPFYSEWDFWVAVATLALVAATIALAAPAWRTVRDAREHSERELRAYVSIESARITINELTKTWESRVAIRNAGKTPAKNLQVLGVLQVVKGWPIEAKLKPIDERDTQANASRFSFGPGSGRTKIDKPELEGAYALMFEVDVAGMREGTWDNPARQTFVAHGKIYYDDVFGHQRVTEYRYYVGGIEGLNDEVSQEDSGRKVRVTGDRTYRMVAHSSGNDAT